MNKKLHTIDTERLLLRPTGLDDAEFILQLLNTPGWLKFVGDRNVHDEKQAAQYIQDRMLPQLDRLGHSNNTIIRKEDGAKVGCCGLYDRDGIDGLDIGFALLPEYERMGYAYEASQAVIDYGKLHFNLNLVNAITDPQNLPSQKLLTKLGLSFVKNIILPNEEVTLMLYQGEFD